MNKKTLILGILATLLMITAAQADDLADWQYEKAVSAYNVGDCGNASGYANRAMERYLSLGDTVGTTKTNDLIKKINNCLIPTGDAFYLSALDHIGNAEQYLNAGNFRTAREQVDLAFAKLYSANETYALMLPPDTERMQKVQTKYLQALQTNKRVELMEADDLYRRALVYLQNEDLPTALAYVRNASRIYGENGDLEGVAKCKEISDQIAGDTTELINRAKYLYEQAVEAYSDADCTNDGFFTAYDFFQQAKDTYVMAGDADGIERSSYFLDQTDQKTRECFQQLLSNVDDMLTEANTQAFLTEECSDYDEAIETANTAKDSLNRLAGFFLKRMSKEEKLAIQGKVYECDILLKKIKDGKAQCMQSDEANVLYDEALKLFGEADYVTAKEKVSEAKEMYVENSDYAGITKSEKLIVEINKALVLLDEADQYYNLSLGFYQSADFENATVYLNKAVSIYSNISRSQELVECNKTLGDINSGLETKNKADKLYDEAMRYSEIREYLIARDFAQQAKELYSKINYEEGVEASDKLLVDFPEPKQQNYVIPLLLLGSVVFVVFLWMRSKTAREKTIKEEDEKRKKEEDDRLKAETEAQNQRREEEKMRMMEERERIREMLAAEKKAIIPGDAPSGMEMQADDINPPRDEINEKQAVSEEDSFSDILDLDENELLGEDLEEEESELKRSIKEKKDK